MSLRIPILVLLVYALVVTALYLHLKQGAQGLETRVAELQVDLARTSSKTEPRIPGEGETRRTRFGRPAYHRHAKEGLATSPPTSAATAGGVTSGGTTVAGPPDESGTSASLPRDFSARRFVEQLRPFLDLDIADSPAAQTLVTSAETAVSSNPDFAKDLVELLSVETDERMMVVISDLLMEAELTGLEPRLIEMARTSPNRSARLSAIDILGYRFYDETDTRSLLRDLILGDTDEVVRARAASHLETWDFGRTEAEPIIESMRELMRSPDPTVRTEAVSALGDWATTDEDSRLLLDSILADPNMGVRMSAIWASSYQYARDSRFREAWLSILTNPSESYPVRLAAADALRYSGVMDDAVKQFIDAFDREVPPEQEW